MQSKQDGHNIASWILMALNILKSKSQLSKDHTQDIWQALSKSKQSVQLTCGAS